MRTRVTARGVFHRDRFFPKRGLFPATVDGIIRVMGLRFEWHETKASANLRKHRVAFEEAKTVFGDPLSLVVPDVEHSVGEDRWVRLGVSARGRLIVVVYTERGEVIRLISGRRATISEKVDYEQANQSPQRE